MSQLLTIYNSIVYTNLKAEKLVSNHYNEIEQIQNQLKPVKDDNLKYLDSATSLLDKLLSSENITELWLLSSEYRKQDKNAITPEEIPFPSPKNKFQKFFYFFIRNLNKATLFYLANKEDAELTDEEIKSDIIFLLRDIQGLIKECTTTDDDDNINYIINLVILSLINIYSETLEICKKFAVDTYVDELEDIIYEVLPDFESEKDTTDSLAYFINKFLNEEKPAEKTISKVAPKPTSQLTSRESFTFIYYKEENVDLTDLCDSLKKYNFISDDTHANDFKRIFSGRTINNPIKWTGNKSELFTFIDLLYREHKLLKDLKQDQWKVANKCFKDKEGNDFNNLRKMSKASNYELIERIIKTQLL